MRDLALHPYKPTGKIEFFRLFYRISRVECSALDTRYLCLCSLRNPVGKHTKSANSDTILAHRNDRVWEPSPEGGYQDATWKYCTPNFTQISK
jgi:hypothetical protein